MPKFRTTLRAANETSGTMTYLAVPPAVMKTFNGRIRVPVVATLNGYAYRTTICDMGLGPCIGVRAAVRKAAGLAAGDRLTVELQVDVAERTVDVPSDFSRALSRSERQAFDAMSYTHRKEYVDWISSAKKPETRERRIEKAREKLRERAST